MTRTDWVVSIYAGAAWGGVFWQGLFLFTGLGGADPLSPKTAIWTVGVPTLVGIGGIVLYRLTRGSTSRRVGAAISIGALIGLPVLGWFSLW